MIHNRKIRILWRRSEGVFIFLKVFAFYLTDRVICEVFVALILATPAIDKRNCVCTSVGSWALHVAVKSRKMRLVVLACFAVIINYVVSSPEQGIWTEELTKVSALSMYFTDFEEY